MGESVRELFLAKVLIVFSNPLVLPKLPFSCGFCTPIVLLLSSSEDDFFEDLFSVFSGSSLLFQMLPPGLSDEQFIISVEMPCPSGLH